MHLIVNPRSGYGGAKLMLAELRAHIRLAGVSLVEYTTRAAGDSTRYAREIAGQAAAVIVWGGDGTVNEVATALAGTNVPLLPFPAGTENLLAKELGIPARPRDVVRILTAGRTIEADVGQVNDRNFLLIIGVGFDAEVVRRIAIARRGHISHLSYFWPIWRTFWEHDFPRLHIIADGEELYHDSGMAFVGNISRYSVGLRICRDAVFDDGLLDLVVFSANEPTSLLLHAAWTLLRIHPLKGNVMYRRVRHVRIESEGPVPSQVDGDLGPVTPLDVSLAPKRLTLLVPPQRNGTRGP